MSNVTIKYTKFKPSTVSFTELDDNARVKSQKIAYPRVKTSTGESNFLIQSPWILIDTYGIPNEGPYYQTDKSRSFIKVPLNVNDPDVKVFRDKLVALDQHIESQKVTIFGSAKTAKKYEMQPIVRTPQVMQDSDDDSDDEDEGSNSKNVDQENRPEYIKVKLDLDYESGNVKTALFRRNEKGTLNYEKDGKRTKMDIKTLDDLQSHVRYLTKVRLIIMANKLWASKTQTNKGDSKRFGMGLKAMQIEFEPRVNTSVNMQETDNFLESSDDEDEDEASDLKEVKKAVKADHFDDDDSDDEDLDEVKQTLKEDDSDDESEDEAPVVKKKSKRTSRKKSRNA